MRGLDTILVPVDFSETSDHALDYATGLTAAFGASLRLLHVVSDADVSPGTEAFWGFDENAVQRRWIDEATTKLDAVARDEGRRELRVEIAVEIGSPFVAIVRHARERSVDLIVMGTHGRGAVAHLLLGSVAEQVVRHAPCPVLTVRLPDHRFERP